MIIANQMQLLSILKVSEVARKDLNFVSRANAGLVVYLFENEVPEIEKAQ